MLQVANVRYADQKQASQIQGKAGLTKKLIKMGLRKRKFKKRLHENDEHLPRKPEPIDETELSLCVLLWQSTIVQALYDIAGNSASSEAKLIKAEAASWFFLPGSNGDFELVCELACLCHSKVRRMARKVAKDGEKALEGFNFRTIRRDLSDRPPTKRTRSVKKGSRP